MKNRTPALFTKTIGGEKKETLGTIEVLVEGTMLHLTDPRDQTWNRIGSDDMTVISIRMPIILEEPYLAMPCGHLVPHPGAHGGAVVCAKCGKNWTVQIVRGETSIRERGEWQRPREA